MELVSLEKEFKIRMLSHQMSVLGSMTAQEYMAAERAKAGVQINEVILEDLADAYGKKVVRESLLNGTFKEKYEKAWQKLTLIMPEHFSLYGAETL